MSRRPNAKHNAALCACPYCRADYEAAKRIADALNVYINGLRDHLWELRTKYMAFRLSDGTSDGVLYDSKKDAVSHQANEFQCMYVCFVNILGGAQAAEVVRVLNFTRDAYDAGLRLTDPDDVNGGRDVAPTAAAMDDARGNVIAIIRPELLQALDTMHGVN